jgi:hypothetical protein
MLSYKERYAQAQGVYRTGLNRVKTTFPPIGQKYPPGAHVRIAKDLGKSMGHFPGDRDATVEYTYAHAYGGRNVHSYSLMVDGIGSVAWYEEWQLTTWGNHD